MEICRVALLSVVFLNVLINIWILAIKDQCPRFAPTGFAGATGATSGSIDGLQRTLDVPGRFGLVANLTQRKANVGRPRLCALIVLVS